jgi:hypothetical protein
MSLMGPFSIGCRRREVVDRRPHRIRLYMLEHIVELVLGEIDAGPSGHQRQSPGVIDVPSIVVLFRLGRCVGFVDDHGSHREDAKIGPTSAQGLGLFAQRRHVVRHDPGNRTIDEDTFRIGCSELSAPPREFRATRQIP